MRSFIASCCLAGIGEWVISSDMEESVFRAQCEQIPDIRQWKTGTLEESSCFAMGRLMATGQPVAMLVKADSDAREYTRNILLDAKRQGLPLLLVTAGTSFDWSDACSSIVIAGENECGDELFKNWNYREPLHIHLAGYPENRNETSHSTQTDLVVEPAPPPSYPRPVLGDLARSLRFHNYEGILLMLGSLEADEQDPALWLAEELKCPVIADASSGLREELSSQCLRDEKNVLKFDLPGTVLRIGDIPSSPFWKDLEQHPEINVYSIARSGYSGLNRKSQLIQGRMEDIAKALGEVKPIGDPCELMKLSRKRQGMIEELLMSHTESSQAFLYDISHFACIADYIHLGGSRMISNWNMVAQAHVPTSFLRTSPDSYGLAGHLACFMGVSSDLDESWCLIDDLSDMNGIESFSLPPVLSSGKRVIVAIDANSGLQQDDTTLRDAVIREGGRYMNLSSSFELKQLDELTDEGLYFIRIVPDSRQTNAFLAKLQS